MTVFAVFYTYDPASDLIAEVRPVHREFLARLKSEGTLIGSGPFTDAEGGALIVIRLEQDATVEDAAAVMDNDPFILREAIDTRIIRPWNPVLNVFADPEI